MRSAYNSAWKEFVSRNYQPIHVVHTMIFYAFLGLAVGCVDNKACEECIEDQIALKKLIQKQLPNEKITIPTREVIRHGCSTAIIAPRTPCAPRYWPLGAGFIMLVGYIVWKKRND